MDNIVLLNLNLIEVFKHLKGSIILLFFIVLSVTSSSHELNLADEEIRKCCGQNEVLFMRQGLEPFNFGCHILQNDFVQNAKENLTVIENNTAIITCPGPPLALVNDPDKWFRETDNGGFEVGLNFWFWPVWLSVPPKSSCWDYGEFNAGHGAFIPGEQPSQSELFQEEYNLSQVVLTCHLDGFDAYISHRQVYGGLYMVSLLFVTLTLGIYITLWTEHNTHGIAQFSFFSALELFYLTEGLRMILKQNGLLIEPTFSCFVHAVAAQYFFMTLNTTSAILGFDIFWTLWKLDPSAYKVKNRKRLSIYLLIGWVLPFLAISIGLVSNHFLSAEAVMNEVGVFEFAHYRCSSPLWQLGFYGQSVLYLLNIGFFFLTSLIICRRQRGQVPSSTRARRLLRETISIHGRLFLILGMTWMAVVIEFIFGQTNPLSFYWLILRVLNLLMGFFFFILFGLNPKHVRILSTRYPSFKQLYNGLGCRTKEYGEGDMTKDLTDSRTQEIGTKFT